MAYMIYRIPCTPSIYIIANHSLKSNIFAVFSLLSLFCLFMNEIFYVFHPILCSLNTIFGEHFRVKNVHEISESSDKAEKGITADLRLSAVFMILYAKNAIIKLIKSRKNWEA